MKYIYYNFQIIIKYLTTDQSNTIFGRHIAPIN